MFYVNHHQWMRTVLLPKTQPIINPISWCLMLLDCFEGTCHCWKSTEWIYWEEERNRSDPQTGIWKGIALLFFITRGRCTLRHLVKKSKYSVTCSTTRGNITTHTTVLQTAGVKRLNWTRAKLQNMPQRVIASYWCILGHGWILTRQMACKTPNRFRNKSNKPRKTIKSNVYLIYRVWGTDAAVLMLNFLHEDSWIYTLLTQTRLIGIYRIYLGTVNNADNLKSF